MTTCDWTNHHGSNCIKPARWWVSEGPKRAWVPRCGLHALMPPFTTRQRVPITEPQPEHFTQLETDSPSEDSPK